MIFLSPSGLRLVSEAKLVTDTLRGRFLTALPERRIGDMAYCSDPLDADLAELGVEMIAPHYPARKRLTQDGRPHPSLARGAALRMDDAIPPPRN